MSNKSRAEHLITKLAIKATSEIVKGHAWKLEGLVAFKTTSMKHKSPIRMVEYVSDFQIMFERPVGLAKQANIQMLV
ncbi:hypothetical protein VSDG_06407 [Cytospora chrysosperma]|uniref:Uncharacterized protein n=1 Tax=Cytospora chrysosperma TaxID=252740 RepID=A0A423VPA9_CYTCH|nr:hypothetical protein VSDG_06407 [Valsa sordida]